MGPPIPGARLCRRAAFPRSGRHHGSSRGDGLAIPIILPQQETDMVASINTALRRRFQAFAWPAPLPFPSFDATPAASAGLSVRH